MENLGIDSKLLIAQAINFIVFFFIFKKFIAKPFFGFINQAKKKEEDQEKATIDMKKKEEAMEAKMKRIEEDARLKSKQMIEEVKEEAAEMKKQMIKEAGDDAKEMKEKALADIERGKQEEQRLMQEKVLELSFFMVNKTLKDVLPEDSKKKVTAAILKNLPSKIS